MSGESFAPHLVTCKTQQFAHIFSMMFYNNNNNNKNDVLLAKQILSANKGHHVLYYLILAFILSTKLSVFDLKLGYILRHITWLDKKSLCVQYQKYSVILDQESCDLSAINARVSWLYCARWGIETRMARPWGCTPISWSNVTQIHHLYWVLHQKNQQIHIILRSKVYSSLSL